MKVSSLAPIDRQQILFDLPPKPVGNHAKVRNVLGRICEAAQERFVGGRRHRTQCTADYCPDVSAGEIFYECKAAGRSNQTFIYTGRLDKDLKFAARRTLVYAVWHHSVDTKACKYEHELEAAFWGTLRGVYLVPFAQIYEICQGLKVEALNSGYGGTDRKVYGSGYRIGVALLAPWKVWDVEAQRAEVLKTESEGRAAADTGPQIPG